jgi:hypothetical protein
MKIKMGALVLDSNGEPDIVITEITCLESEYDCGAHYDMARDIFNNEQYDVLGVFDENDSAFNKLKG